MLRQIKKINLIRATKHLQSFLKLLCLFITTQTSGLARGSSLIIGVLGANYHTTMSVLKCQRLKSVQGFWRGRVRKEGDICNSNSFKRCPSAQPRPIDKHSTNSCRLVFCCAARTPNLKMMSQRGIRLTNIRVHALVLIGISKSGFRGLCRGLISLPHYNEHHNTRLIKIGRGVQSG